MFPAENMWNWLQRTIGNPNRAEACMMLSHQDKQFCAQRALLNADPPKYSNPTKYIHDPDLVSYEEKGIVRSDAMGPLDKVSLVRFYIDAMPGLKSLFTRAVTVWVSENRSKAIRDAGIRYSRTGWVFLTNNHMYSFFSLHFSGEKYVYYGYDRMRDVTDRGGFTICQYGE